MQSLSRRPEATTRTRPATRHLTVCVVDPRTDDYQAWSSLAEERGIRLTVCGSAAEALRLARCTPVDLWVVNTDLPGVSGFDLCGMLKNQTPHTAVYLVSDDYSPEAERAAWQARATLFGCKPAHRDWLQHFITARTSQGESSCVSRIG